MLKDLPIRKIIHVDMDAFYASVEQMDNPELKGKALAVGGGGKRGVISAASYEARKFGVKSAMSGRLAIKLCPELIFVRTDFTRYTEISKRVRLVTCSSTSTCEKSGFTVRSRFIPFPTEIFASPPTLNWLLLSSIS